MHCYVVSQCSGTSGTSFGTGSMVNLKSPTANHFGGSISLIPATSAWHIYSVNQKYLHL